MRLPYLPDDLSLPDSEGQAVLERIKERRGGKLLPLDKTLLYAPPIADGWNSFLKAIRSSNSLPVSVREIAMTRVSALNGAWDEWDIHAPLLLQTGEVSKKSVQELKSETLDGKDLDEKFISVLGVTDAMTKDVTVPQETFDKLKKHFNNREIIELIATIAAVNCVTRFAIALDVGEMLERPR